MLSVSSFHCVPRITAGMPLAKPFLTLMSELTDLIVVELGMSSFDEGMMVLAIKDEGVGRTSDLVFLRSFGFWLLSSWNDAVVSEEIARRRDLNHTTIDIFNRCHWRLNHIANKGINVILDAIRWDRTYRRRVAMTATPSSPIVFLRVMGISMQIEAPELMFWECTCQKALIT